MSDPLPDLADVKSYFDRKIKQHGPVAAGLDCRDDNAVFTRYDQILKVLDRKSGFSLLDYGCGYGGLASYMQNAGFTDFDYIGRDFSAAMIESAVGANAGAARRFEVGDLSDLPSADYVVASGVFNIKLNAAESEWQSFAQDAVRDLFACCNIGLAVNFLTGYSDADRKRADLFYPSPEAMFSFCKGLTRNVALLHDYDIYDFTVILRKQVITGAKD